MTNEMKVEVEAADVTTASSRGYRALIGVPQIVPRKMRELGIRIRQFKENEFHPAHDAIQIFDVETGEQVGNISDAKVSFPIRGAIEVEVKFFPKLVETIE